MQGEPLSLRGDGRHRFGAPWHGGTATALLRMRKRARVLGAQFKAAFAAFARTATGTVVNLMRTVENHVGAGSADWPRSRRA